MEKRGVNIVSNTFPVEEDEGDHEKYYDKDNNDNKKQQLERRRNDVKGLYNSLEMKGRNRRIQSLPR